MHVLIGVALSLTLGAGHNGGNGFDPTMMYVLPDGVEKFRIDTSYKPFRDWLDADLEHRPEAIKYFVACAFDQGTVIRFDDGARRFTWRGRMGLAQHMQKNLVARLQYGKGSESVYVALPRDEGTWVSACLMAHANMAGSHEYILLRGNPPAWPSGPSSAELWTMGYPEGVFFADLLNVSGGSDGSPELARSAPRAPPTKAQLEDSFTMSLNLPKGYAEMPAAGWAPPNGSNGRVLDFAGETSGVAPFGAYRVARKLGTYLENKARFLLEGAQHDPDYASDLVCVGSGQLVDCKPSGVERLRPLFVHAPRVVSLASATTAANELVAIQALDTGGAALTDPQRAPCTAGVTCAGPFRLTSTGEAPLAPTDRQGRTLVRLGAKQSVTVVLRWDLKKPPGPFDPRAERFTAIIRYRSRREASATIEVSDPGGGLRVAGQTWPATPPSTPTGWQWMQVYPVYAVKDPLHSGGRLALKVQVTGPCCGESPLELDIAGFVPGPPWCLESQGGCFTGVCTDEDAVASMLRPEAPRHGR